MSTEDPSTLGHSDLDFVPEIGRSGSPVYLVSLRRVVRSSPSPRGRVDFGPLFVRTTEPRTGRSLPSVRSGPSPVDLRTTWRGFLPKARGRLPSTSRLHGIRVPGY